MVVNLPLLVLALLATYRLTRLVTLDVITDTPRRWLQRRLPEALAYLIGCPWCASIWLAIPISGAVVMWPTNRLVLVVLLGLSGSAVAGILARGDEPTDLGEFDPSLLYTPDADTDE